MRCIVNGHVKEFSKLISDSQNATVWTSDRCLPVLGAPKQYRLYSTEDTFGGVYCMDNNLFQPQWIVAKGVVRGTQNKLRMSRFG